MDIKRRKSRIDEGVEASDVQQSAVVFADEKKSFGQFFGRFKNFNFDFKKYLKKKSVWLGAVTLIVIVAILLQTNPQASGATYTWTQTGWDANATPGSSLVHPDIGTTYESKTNMDTSSGTDAKLSFTSDPNFSETFTDTTYKDAVNTDANWSGGQVSMATETNGTNLYEKLNGILAGNTIVAQIKIDDDVYVGACGGKFLKYSTVSDTVTDLGSKISSLFPAKCVHSFGYDSAHKVLYIGGGGNAPLDIYGSTLVRYNLPNYSSGGTYPTADTVYDLSSKLTAANWNYGASSRNVFSFAYDSASDVLYITGALTNFGRYNSTFYGGGDAAYPTANTVYDLTPKLTGFWTDNTIDVYSSAYDSTNKILYIAGGSGKFARYNTTAYTGGGTYPDADTAYELTSKISSFWGTNVIYSLVVDSTNKNVYLGGGSTGQFARYNYDSYVAGGTYPTADTAYNLTSKISSIFPSSISLMTMNFDSANNVVYLGGGYRKMGRYNTTFYSAGGTYPTADTAYDLTSKFSVLGSDNLYGNSGFYSLILDVSSQTLYAGGYVSKFGRYNTTFYAGGGTYPTADTGYDLTSKANGVSWNGTVINVLKSASNNEIYIGGSSGKFAKYNTVTGVATDLTSKISSFWSTYDIKNLAFDLANGVVYLGGTGGNAGKFARYNTATYSAGGTYPTADTAYDLTSKISSFGGTYRIYSLVYDNDEKVVYLAGGYNSTYTVKFGRYNTTFYASGGTYPAADTGYNLTTKITATGVTPYTIDSMALDPTNKTIYLIGDTALGAARFFRYNTVSYAGGGTYPDADTAYNLTAKISAHLTNTGIAIAFDSSNSVVYLAGGQGKFARYNTTTYSGGGTYPDADTGYNLSTKISSFWSTNTIFSLALDSVNNVVYLAGLAAKFARYSIAADSATNLRSPDTMSFLSTYQMTSSTISGNKVYIAGYSGSFGEKPLLGSTSSAVSLAADNVAYNIYYATLTKNDTVGTGTITYYLSNNGGSDWEQVTPSSEHQFSTVGSDLRFKITVSGNATVQDITIAYKSYNASGNLISSAYNTNDFTNVIGGLSWNEDASLPAGASVTVSLRTAGSQGGLTGAWSDFTNATANCAKDGGTVTCSVDAIPAGLKDNSNDQWVQYKVALTSAGDFTPTVTDVSTSYVVNASPQFDATFGTNGVNAAQLARTDADHPGQVKIEYSFKDPDTATGTYTPNYVTPSFEYSLNGGSDWSAINPANITFGTAPAGGGYSTYNGNTTNKVLAGSFLTYTAYWDAKTEINGSASNTFQVRVSVDDNETANHLVPAIGNTTTLDVKNPVDLSLVIDHSASNGQLTIGAPTEDSSYQMMVSESPTFAGATLEAFASPFTFAIQAADPAIVYLKIVDDYGNSTETSATTPAKPTNVVYYDTSNINLDPAEYREFIAWGAISAEQDGAGFAEYDIYRKVDNGSFSQRDSVSDRQVNYYVDDGLDMDKRYYYKIKTVDISGNTSDFSSPIVDDVPDGQGGSDSTPPTIDGVTVSNIETTSATVTWTTDEDSNSYVYFSADPSHSYADGVQGVPTRSTTHTVNLSGLTPSTTYHIKVESEDSTGNKGVVCNGGENCSPGTGNQLSFDTATGPGISNVRIKESTNEQATIAWETDANSDSHVHYSSQVSNGELVDPLTEGTTDNVGGVYPFQHEVTITNLSASVPYYFYVESEGANGIATLKNVTADPPFFTFLTGNDNTDPVINADDPIKIITSDSVAINWSTNEPADSKVEYKKNSQNYSDNVPVTIASYDYSHYIIITGLDPDTRYTYRLTSKDINGNEAVTTDKIFTTLKNAEFQHNPLSEITDISDPPTVLTDEKAVISFQTDEPAKCAIEYGTETGNYQEVPVTETQYNREHSIHLAGLVFTTQYFYKINCVDNLETAVDSDEYTFTTLEEQMTQAEANGSSDTTAPIISSLSVSNITGESAIVTWNTDENANSSVALGITSEAYDNVAANYAVNSDKENFVTKHSVIIHNLIPATKYYYAAISYDAAGNITQSSEAAFTTKAPSSLSSVKVVSKNLNQAVITWKTGVKTSSVVEYGLTTAYGEEKESKTATTDHEITISGLESKTTYHFRVKGTDADGNLFASSDNTFEPKSPPQISNFKASDVSEHGSKVTFTTDVPTDALITFADINDTQNTGSQGKPDLTSKHEVELKNLTSGTTYAVKIRVRDEAGNETEETFPNFTTGKDENPPKIDQVRTDSALAQNDKVQSIISWITDEPATTEIIYKEGRAGQEREVKVSPNYVPNHVAVITIFKPGTVYYFKTKSVDQAGNEATSSEFALLTPKRRENIIQIIVGNFQDIFKWAQF